MELNLNLPNLDENNATARKIRSYLVRLNEQLNFVLSNIDEGNFTPAVRDSVSAASSVKKDVAGLREAIVNTADFVKSTEEKIMSTLKNQYVATADIGSITEEAIASYEFDGKGFDQYFSLVSDVSGQVDKICGYVKTGVLEDGSVGLEIANLGGDGESPFKVRLTDNKLSFFASGAEVAYMSDSTLYITKAQVSGTLVLGDYTVDVTNGVAFKWNK